MKSYIITILATVGVMNTLWTADYNRTVQAAQAAIDEATLTAMIEMGEPQVAVLQPPNAKDWE